MMNVIQDKVRMENGIVIPWNLTISDIVDTPDYFFRIKF